MWLWNRRTSTKPLPGVTPEEAAAVVAEATAVVEGRAADLYRAQRRPVPPWAWLNAVAHRPPERPGTAASPADTSDDAWATAAAGIAACLLDAGPERAARVQTTLLVTLELEALRRPGWPTRPGAVLSATQRLLDQLASAEARAPVDGGIPGRPGPHGRS
ncbi:MAG TPA: hypothetical protein VGL49_01495 [Acidimicrobiales bacterium]